ncbi:MAG: chromate transporter [Synergistes jonesii]|uniref:chromate transporter n=1 Tax=Synergistes jonesii TaxID=2754 RepID=UPI002A7652A1|nr:chromate transporter [Synergistes jonesii]MDY2985195.1 chromate transporter [Synergistes jonesii]
MTKIIELVWAFAQIGITAFGGGLSTLSLIEYQLVTKNGWLDAVGFGKLIAVSQMTPGPIAVNAATFAGYSEAGLAGSAAATFAIVATPLLALSAVLLILRQVNPEGSKRFKLMLRPIVAGLLTLSIVSPFMITWNNGVTAVALLASGIALVRFCRFFKEYPVAMLAIFGILGAIFMR